MKKQILFSVLILFALSLASYAPATVSKEEVSAEIIANPKETLIQKLSGEKANKNETLLMAAFEHTTIPGDPGTDGLFKDEINTANTADGKFSFGDSFRLNNLERPFTSDDMVYHPETDIVRLMIQEDADFYYFTFELSGVDTDAGYPSAAYGIEFDTNRDGRGDFLLLAQGDSSTEWNIDGVMVLRDSNGDVGGTRPVLPDNGGGDGYDEVVFSAEVLDDPDAAWKRVDPAVPGNIQLAVKIDLIDNSSFFWKAFADGGMVDPSQLDYNDNISESEAGSPNTISKYYPVGELNLIDSTCWIAYNFRPTGYELGSCASPPPHSTPVPAEAPGV